MSSRWPLEVFKICKLTVAHTYHTIYPQFVFPVKSRNPLIDKRWRDELFAVIGNLINETNCRTIIKGGVEDHVHCFLSLKPAVSISELMKTVKAKSSKYINDNKLTVDRFEWQERYGVFSYSQSHIDNVYRYIQNQEKHHQSKTFKDEYIELLEAFQIDYDQQYVFHDPL